MVTQLFKPSHLHKLNNWKKQRELNWLFKEKPFNPKEQWRKRKCRTVSPVKTQIQVSYGPTIYVKQHNSISHITNISNGWSTITPTNNCNETDPRWSLPKTQYPTFVRIQRWFNSLMGFIDKRVAFRLRYKGKSFRWHRKLKSVLLRFGHSHVVLVKPLTNIKWRKHGRMKMIFFGTNLWSLKHFLQKLIKWRVMNIYHGRGLRLAQQKVLRKSGKVSAYR